MKDNRINYSKHCTSIVLARDVVKETVESNFQLFIHIGGDCFHGGGHPHGFLVRTLLPRLKNN